MKLGTHVAAGLMVAGGIAALAAGGVLLLGAAAATAGDKIGVRRNADERDCEKRLCSKRSKGV